MKTSALVSIGDTATTIVVDGPGADDGNGRITLPCGVKSLRARHIRADPPLPEELTNAIGEMIDHLDDALRELPALVDASNVTVAERHVEVIAAVEHGGPINEDSFVLSREAAEDVFRTVATENANARRLNPGLPAGDVDTIVPACCALVAVMRGLHLDAVTVSFGDGATGGAS
jgi:exopolyphosphatase / guanosine-5'-triphosphate,3'-diphosphate pyrophosphatase